MTALELLAPARNTDIGFAAIDCGADAVYIAGPAFGARQAAGNSLEDIKALCSYAHRFGARIFATVNTLVLEQEMEQAQSLVRGLEEAGVDALIVQDPAVLSMSTRLPLHASTQCAIRTAEKARFLESLGYGRLVLERQLSLEQIKSIRDAVDVEIECFVHGALCVCYSGECYLSEYLTGRSANRGACAQPCRYQYYLMEEKRPGEYFPVFEDEKGTYIMNSRDMCMIDHLDDLMRVGVDCIKIEGRAKSAYYAAIVTGAYRHVLDDLAAGRPVDPVWRDEVEKVSHRHYSTGFFYGEPGQYYEDSRYIREYQVVAIVTDCDESGLATLSLRNKFSAGDEIEAVGPDLRPFPFSAGGFTSPEGEALTEVRTPQMVFSMRLPRPVPPWTILRHRVELSAK